MFKLTPFNRNFIRSTQRPKSFFDLADEFFQDDFMQIPSLSNASFKIDIKEQDNVYVIDAELPGIDKEDISLNYEDGLLKIVVNKVEEKNEESEKYLHRERVMSSMQRTLNLGDLDFENIEAELKDGILKINAPKSNVIENTRSIEIK